MNGLDAKLTSEQQRQLAAVLLSPLAQQAIETANQKKAERRAELLGAWRSRKAVLLKQHAAARKSVDALRPVVLDLDAALVGKIMELRAADDARSNASHAMTNGESRLDFDLRELGGEAIQRALRAIAHADMAARAGFTGHFAAKNWRGDVTEVEPKDPTLNGFLARMRELRAEIEALIFSDLAPQEIERRCDEAVGEAQARETPLKVDGARLMIPPPAGLLR